MNQKHTDENWKLNRRETGSHKSINYLQFDWIPSWLTFLPILAIAKRWMRPLNAWTHLFLVHRQPPQTIAVITTSNNVFYPPRKCQIIWSPVDIQSRPVDAPLPKRCAAAAMPIPMIASMTVSMDFQRPDTGLLITEWVQHLSGTKKTHKHE